ncbi:DNA cytosine methyltransferase [Amycolatopsis regifaucium]|uniref:DNA cytosine methyltransferase n=1 Tax=Amycolatopsis regifaucium TaxID=546365 RepID=A0A154MPX4_9PSEU|nr:DNA cytosine methyltransferase [Amycolatopsis regifaucium]KZB86361.1 DNA methyltransferase [Amycolatopsis regifaucium]OKA06451.1 DNA cytosine methyltransferase [Amycolatopsis regifaucium]SFJ26816.1 C-5 cytosine-specific DNA methylase [Amycolatopsis regifaucium]
MSRTATHRPAKRRRHSRHDDPVAVELFSGFGGLTQGIKLAGFETIMAANHNEFKVEVHEANHPEAEHWIADLVDPESGDYHDARDLPAGDLLSAGVSCVNHSIANTIKAYEQGLTLFSMTDPEFEERVTRSERDRATANCVLHYAAVHHPRLILVECTTELTSWGPAIPGKPKVGDGSTYRWWLKQFDTLGYDHKIMYLNSMFFGVPQSRDRYYAAFWDKNLPAPDLEHRPESWCARCDTTVEAVWSWKTGVPASGSVRYGKQYNYRCPRCRVEVFPPMTPSLAALDLTNLGTRIGDKPHRKQRDGSVGPLAAATMARAERCRQRFADFPAVLMPAKAVHGTEKHLWQPMATQTSQQETAILSTGAVIAAHRHNGDGQHITRPMDTVTSTHEKAMLLAVANFQGAPRGAGDPLPTQAGSETLGMVSAGVVPFRQNTIPTVHTESMPTVTSDQIPGLLTAAGTIKNNGAITEADYRAHPVSNPLGTIVSTAASQAVLFSGWHGTDAATAANLNADWRAKLVDLTLDDCYFRMLGKHEIGRGCGFDVDFPGYQGTFIVWGTARAQTDGFGNAVSPAVGAWIGARLRAVLDTPEAIA